MKEGFVYALIASGFFILVIFSNHQHTDKDKPNSKRGLGRRLILKQPNFTTNSTHKTIHVPVTFDPIVAEYEQKREDRAWEKEYFQQQYKKWGEVHNQGAEHQAERGHIRMATQSHDVFESHHGSAQNHQQSIEHAPGHEEQPPWDTDYGEPDDDYLNGEEFNILHRLEILFPLIDVKPKDGFLNLEELGDWHVEQANKLALHRIDREIEARDKNHDGLISITEYLPDLKIDELGNASMEHGEPGWWKQHFDLADDNNDGLLNRTEYFDFLHPTESKNPKLHKWVRMEELKEYDDDKDEKISLTEFDRMFDVFKYYGVNLSHLHQGNDAEARKAKFTELDKDKDGFLNEAELEPVMDLLHPGESFYARQQAEQLIQQADDDKDGRLSLKEMLDHPYIFYATAHSPEDYADYSHDEFR